MHHSTSHRFYFFSTWIARAFFLSGFLVSQNLSAQTITKDFFDQANTFFQNNVADGKVKYARAKTSSTLTTLVQTIEKADLFTLDEASQKAFKINAYNLWVIKAAADLYPIASVQDEAGFFDRKKITVAGKQYTLTEFEKKELLKVYDDPRLHFVLVCGAVGCPPIIAEAYRPATLDTQLDRQTKLALNDPAFIIYNNKTASLSKIFDWYSHDFGGNKKAILTYINQYRTEAIPATAKLTYYPYDWTLNDAIIKKPTLGARTTPVGTNAGRYVVSSTIPKGSVETKIFNNLYTQRTGSKQALTSRATFFTTSISVLYGLTNRLNVGLVSRYRRVRNEGLPSDAISVFQSGERSSSRHGFTGVGPQVRFAPYPKWTNFSIQSSFTFPIGDQLAGGSDDGGNNFRPYIDWNGPIWNTQIFNDLSIGSSFSLFTEVDVLLEDIGKSSEGHVNRWSTPATVIFSYNPTSQWIVYTLGGFSPFWQSEFDYFIQGGFGTKYQFTPNFELELLYTGFRNKAQIDTGGRAATYNLGVRFNL